MKAIYLVLFIFVLLFTGCTFLNDLFLLPNETRTPPTVNLTFPDGQPTYIGEDVTIKVATSPAQQVAYIKVVMVDWVNDAEIVQQVENAKQGTFNFKIISSKVSFYVETPFQNKEKSNEKWYPSKDSWFEFTDYSPPELDFSVERISKSNNEYRLRINAVDKESGLKRVYYQIDGVQQTVSNTTGNEINVTVVLEIGMHQIVVSAVNNNNLMNSKEQEVNVTPPDVESYPIFEGLKDQEVLEGFRGSTIYIQGIISDSNSYLKKIEIISTAGWSDVINFDPLQESYNLLYPIEVEEDQTITITAYNGNNYQIGVSIIVKVNDHQAPDVDLIQKKPIGSEFEVGTEIEFELSSQAYDEESLENIYYLLNNMPIRIVEVGNEKEFKESFTYRIRNGRNSFTAVAKDSKDAKRTSQEIVITGFKLDDEEPEIVLLMPDVAYKDITTELKFIAEDFDSGVKDASIIIDGTGNYILNGIDNYFYSTNWTPSVVGSSTVEVTVTDKKDNEAKAAKLIMVKDPTGIKWPTIQEVSVNPDPVILGGTVDISLNVVPPADYPELNPIVEFEVSAPGANPGGLTEVERIGNTYRSKYSPNTKGVHNVQAMIQWEDNQVVKDTNFEVLSPEPTLTFTVEPSRTYIGDIVEIRLQTDTSNPYASVTVLEMSVDDDPLIWQTIINNEQLLYNATKSTLNLGPGQHVVKIRIKDSFENETVEIKQFYLVEPVLEIESINLVPINNVKNMVYKDSYFEVLVKQTLPENIASQLEGSLKITGNNEDRSLTLEASGNYRFISEKWTPLQQGNYNVDASLIKVISSKTYEDEFSSVVTVYPPEIGAPLLRLVGDSKTLVYGEAFDFELFFNDPQKAENISVEMYVVDEILQKIDGTDFVKADEDEGNPGRFVSNESFKLYEAIRFKGAAKVIVIDQNGEYEMPTIYSTTTYTLEEPSLDISLVDNAKEYYNNLWNSLDIRVSVPGTLTIQQPVISLEGPGTGNPPYEIPTGDNGIYKYKIKPEYDNNVLPTELPINITIYEISDINQTDPLFTKNATLNVKQWEPKIEIVEMNFNDKVNKSKSPKVLFRIEDIPDNNFYNLDYNFSTLLNGKIPVQGYFVGSLNDNVTLDFKAGDYSDKDENDLIPVTATATIRNEGEVLGVASGQATWTVVLPEFSRVTVNARLSPPYETYAENTIDVTYEYNYISDESLEVSLIYGLKNGTKTTIYIEPDYDNKQAVFDPVVFTQEGNYELQSNIYCTNGTKTVVATSTKVEVQTKKSNTNVAIDYPNPIDPIFTGQSIRPRVKVTNIPEPEVRVDVSFESTKVISNGTTKELPVPDDSNFRLFELDTNLDINQPGKWTVEATVDSDYLDEEKTASVTFRATDGKISDIRISKASTTLSFNGEVIEFVGNFFYTNPYKTPSWSAGFKLPNGTDLPDTLEELGYSTNTNTGEYTVNFKTDGLSYPDTKVEIKFQVQVGDTTEDTTKTFIVFKGIDPPSFQLSDEKVTEGETITADIQYNLSGFFIENASPVDSHISGNFEIPYTSYVSGPTPTDPATKAYIISLTRRAGRHDGDPGTIKEFTAVGTSSIDGKIIFNKPITFSIENQ